MGLFGSLTFMLKSFLPDPGSRIDRWRLRLSGLLRGTAGRCRHLRFHEMWLRTSLLRATRFEGGHGRHVLMKCTLFASRQCFSYYVFRWICIFFSLESKKCIHSENLRLTVWNGLARVSYGGASHIFPHENDSPLEYLLFSFFLTKIAVTSSHDDLW